MGVYLSYPGIYLEELPSSIHVLTGVSTAATAFVDWFARGPMEIVESPGAAPLYRPRAARVEGWAEFQRLYGGLDHASEASYGVMQFFVNGGQTAWVVRVTGEGRDFTAAADLPQSPFTLWWVTLNGTPVTDGGLANIQSCREIGRASCRERV